MRYLPDEVDRLYRDLPAYLDGAMIAHPVFSDGGRERRPVDELPARVVEAMHRWMALESLTSAQRAAYKAVVIGLVRVYERDQWRDAPWHPMTCRECGEYLDLDEKAVGELLRRARVKLAARLSDDEETAA